MTQHPFTMRVIELIRSIPLGTVSTYGKLAALAGNPRSARQVARILHSLSRKEGLPWHRVVNREGRISLSEYQGYERQKRLLEDEGITFDHRDRVDLDLFLWRPEPE